MTRRSTGLDYSSGGGGHEISPLTVSRLLRLCVSLPFVGGVVGLALFDGSVEAKGASGEERRGDHEIFCRRKT